MMPAMNSLPIETLPTIAVEDQPDRGRNGRGDQRADGDRRGRKALAVALLDHRRAEDARLHRRVRNGRAGYAAHQGGEQDRDLRQAARHPADRDHRNLQQAVGDAALVHQMAGEHEERHGEQRKALAHRGDLLHADRHRHAARSTTKKTKPAMPVAKATGIPTAMSTTKTMEISSIV